MVMNEQGQIRRHRVDRIRDVSIQPEAFAPSYSVEF